MRTTVDVVLANPDSTPDELRGNVVKAFIVLAGDREPSDELAEEIKAFVRERLSAYAYPRRIEFVDVQQLAAMASGELEIANLAFPSFALAVQNAFSRKSRFTWSS